MNASKEKGEEVEITWSLEDEILTLTLHPETEGDKVVIEYCNNFQGLFRKQERKDASYYSGLEKIKGAEVVMKAVTDKD